MTTVKQWKKISMHCHGKKAELWFATNYSHWTTNLIFCQNIDSLSMSKMCYSFQKTKQDVIKFWWSLIRIKL